MSKAPEPPRIDPSKPTSILVVGRKGSGKSTAAHALWSSWPHDAICLDPTGDADPPDAEPVTTPLPTKFPERGDDGLPKRLRFQPDSGADTYLDDMDRCLGLALYPKDKPVLIWVDEGNRLGHSQSKGAVMQRRLLNESRHYACTCVFCCPRPSKIDPLWISQADFIFVYHLPNPRDRETLADNMGYPPDRFHQECSATWARGPFWFMLWDAKQHRLWRMPPMPVQQTAA